MQPTMLRSAMLDQLEETTEWDIIIIGGGATGLGSAVDAASRGYKTLLLEKFDFGKGTSSRATKLVHGGVRYLAQGNIKLVMEALKERGLLLKNAPHLTRIQPFVLPVYSWWQKLMYGTGLRIYDLMAGRLSIGKTKLLSKKAAAEKLPALNHEKLKGGVLYYDGQFDDARLALTLAQTAAAQGATLLNYMEVVDITKENGLITGLIAEDILTEKEYGLKAKVVVNATGVFVDDILQMDDDNQPPIVSPSQGIHLVVDKKFFPGTHALMIPKTDDGRVLFAVPWQRYIIIGTTDTAVQHIDFEPRALEQEIAFIFRNINRYLNSGITEKDIKTVFAGLRPLVKAAGQKNTAMLSRDHTIVVSKSRLVTITGGKWTTYRKMGKDAIDNAAFAGKLPKKSCVTETLPLYGAGSLPSDVPDFLSPYGTAAEALKTLMEEQPELSEKIHPDHVFTKAQVLWAVRNEMAMTVEDVLARRLRLLFVDAQAAIDAAPVTAAIMAGEMGKGNAWIEQELALFNELAGGYLIHDLTPGGQRHFDASSSGG